MSIFLRHSVPRILASYHRVLSTRHLSSSTLALKDPWPMPHTPEHVASTASPADLPPPEPLPRPGETIETTRARLIYQSRKRGTLESDLLLSTFAKEHLGTMDAEELSEFDKVRVSYPRLRHLRSTFFFSFCSSLWTNRTGTFIIGPRENGRRLSGGRARTCSRS
jgi:hypothetical protein